LKSLHCKRRIGPRDFTSVVVQKSASLLPLARHADFRTKATLDQ
jgi:hypothetical protein